MSVWASILGIEDERQWMADLEAQGIGAGAIRDGEPEPDDLDAPIVYQGSHVVPDDTDERGGSVDLACLPGHITRDARDDGDGPGLPYLRLGVQVAAGLDPATVILTERQARRLHETLGEWLERRMM